MKELRESVSKRAMEKLKMKGDEDDDKNEKEKAVKEQKPIETLEEAERQFT